MRQGFSLVELSIVLVILGLLTGGILAGQSLIRAAELRSVGTEYQRYITAVQSFRDKYFALPGDMANATSFWGAAHATPATCKTTASTSVATCDGDGSGTLNSSTGSEEILRFWQHLANAGLIEGSYTGAGTTTVSVNAPASKLSNGRWTSNYIAGIYVGTTQSFAGEYGNYLQFQTQSWSVATSNSGPLSPEEAWNIDTKLDDGIPRTGRIWSHKGRSPETLCTTAAGAAVASENTATYLLNNPNKDCVLNFVRI